MKKLRIAQVGTIWEATPPKLYGGTERIVYELTEDLVRRGHDVTLFATGDSETSAKLEYILPEAAYRQGIEWTNHLYPLLHISKVFERADEFDVIHVHLNTSMDYVALVLAGLTKTPVIFSTHFVLPLEKDVSRLDRRRFLLEHKDRNFVSISDAQRTMPEMNYIKTVYNGLSLHKFPFYEKGGEDLVWLGRICFDKGTKEAIEVAKRTGRNLILAGKLDQQNKSYLEYYEKEVKPHIDGKQIKYIGEVDDAGKAELMKTATALINPIKWNEPFGLVNVEAMSMGVPVIATNIGPMSELIVNGKTGFVVDSLDEMVAAVDKVGSLDRQAIRDHALQKFSAEAMTDGYLEVYNSLI